MYLRFKGKKKLVWRGPSMFQMDGCVEVGDENDWTALYRVE